MLRLTWACIGHTQHTLYGTGRHSRYSGQIPCRIGGSACSYQPGFAFSALPEWSNV